MVHPTQLTQRKGKEMLDVIWTLILLFIGGSSVVVIGALSIWIADASYKRKMRKENKHDTR